MKVSINELKSNLLKILSKNMNDEDSNIVADYFIWAEMCANKTQGLVKLIGTEPIQDIIAEYPMKIEKETLVSIIIDGGKNPSISVISKAISMAAKKAKEVGIAIVGIRNTFSSNGAQSYYVEKLAKMNLIGIMVSRSPGAVAPFNSIDPLFGTNPIGYAFPTNEEPIVFDGSTAAIPFYKLVVAKANGEKIPEGIAIDKNGNITTDPAIIIEDGAILPFGNSHKAAGLSMLVELLSGPLIGSAYLDYQTFDQEWGTTIIAINPEILVDINKFKEEASDFVSIIKNSRTKDNEKISFPYDKSRNNYQECLKSGFINIDDVIYNRVKSLVDFNEENN